MHKILLLYQYSCRNSMTQVLHNQEVFEKNTITGSYKLLFRGSKYEELTISLKDDQMDWFQIEKSQTVGLPRTGDKIKKFIDSCYARVARIGSGYKVYLEGRILGGSKIPVLDQIFRSFGSLGDVICGNPQKAAKRWENWTEDSFLSNFGKTVGLTVASGATAMVGETGIASNLIQKAGDSGQKLGGMALSSTYQIGGIGAQVLTLGIPNPISGAYNASSAAMNNVIDKNVKENKYGLNWNELGNQAVIGLAKGAASSGGIIPYAGKAVQASLRGEKVEFDHGEEWVQWGVNVGVTAVTMGTVKGVNALTQAGKIGFKTALGIGGSSGFISGLGAGYLSQVIHSSALQDKLEGEGYKFKQNRVDKESGSYYAVYSKKGSEDVFLPCPDLGDAVGVALLQGIMSALTAGKQYQKVKPKADKFYGASRPRPNYTNQRRLTMEALNEFQVENVPGQHSHRNQQLANELQWRANWHNVSSQSNVAMKVLYKVHNGGIDVLFLQHAGPLQYGPFTPSDSGYFINMINKMSDNAFKNGGMKITNIGLLGCEVTLDWKNFLKARTGINILTLPNCPNSFLEINDLNQFKYYTNNTMICQGPLHTIVQHMT